jgi:hypothetical protein
MMDCDVCAAMGEMRTGGKTEALRENTPSHSSFVHHKSHMTWPGIETGSPRLDAGD